MDKQRQPLYTGIYEAIRTKILAGELKPNERLPSESELAEQYKVSRITSKRAMEELTREGLIYRLRGSGSYVARRAPAKDGEGVTAKAIYGLSIPFGSSLGRSADIVRGASDYLSKKGCLLSIQVADFDANKEREIIRGFAEHGVQGLILYPVFDKLNLDLLYELTLENFPIVTIDKYIEGMPLRSIVTDNLGGAQAAVGYLVERGHRSIGFYADLALSDSVSVRDRFFGYRKALRDHGINVCDDFCKVGFAAEISELIPGAVDILRFKKPLTRPVIDYFKVQLDLMLDRAEPITAIFALNDYIAISLIRCALECGIKVPQQLSVIGFDNIELAQHAEIPLTTIEQNFYQMGYEAARTLIRQVAGERLSQADLVINLPVRIIERQSVADLLQTKSCKDKAGFCNGENRAHG